MSSAPRGRPRDADVDARIVLAARAAIIDTGYDALSVEGVAARAGVAKTTVYRRYPGKAELVLAAVASAIHEAPVPDLGSLRLDLERLVDDHIHQLQHGHLGAMVRALQLALAERPDLAPLASGGFLAERKRDVDVVVDRAIARGELPPGVDREMVFDLCFGAVFMRGIVMHLPIARDYGHRLVATALRGYGVVE